MDQPTPPPSSQPTHDHHWGPSQIVITVVVIVVLLLLGFWMYNLVGRDGEAPNEIITSVREGEVVEDFPQELLDILETVPPTLALAENPEFRESYSVTYRDSDARQPVVRYTSSLSLGDSVSVFATFFANNREWEVINYADPETTDLTSFYARHENGGEVNVTFIPGEEGSAMVEISYLASGETILEE
jgi:hypothetical protein